MPEYMNLQDYLNDEPALDGNEVILSAWYSPSDIHSEEGGNFPVYFSKEMEKFLGPWMKYLGKQANQYGKWPQFQSGVKGSDLDMTSYGYKERSAVAAYRMALYYLFPDTTWEAIDKVIQSGRPVDGCYSNCTIDNIMLVLKGQDLNIPALSFKGMYERLGEGLFDKNVLDGDILKQKSAILLDNARQYNCKNWWAEGGHKIKRIGCPFCGKLASLCEKHDGLVLLCDCEDNV